MRKGELLNLCWSNIDFNQRMIFLGKTKSGKTRSIPMNDTVYDCLIKIKENNLNNKYVFCYKNGKRIKAIRHSFKKALIRAEIKDFKFHDLRHTFASHLDMNNVNLLTVKELLGHSTINMTLRYAHLASDEKQKAVNSLCSGIDTIWTLKRVVDILDNFNYNALDDKITRRGGRVDECGGLENR